jgi:hypothetical protein
MGGEDRKDGNNALIRFMVQMFLVGIYGPNVVDLDPMVKISLENTRMLWVAYVC